MGRKHDKKHDKKRGMGRGAGGPVRLRGALLGLTALAAMTPAVGLAQTALPEITVTAPSPDRKSVV